VIVVYCAVTQALHIGCLSLRHLYTDNSYHIPVESIAYPHCKDAHTRTTTLRGIHVVMVKQCHHRFVIIQNCTSPEPLYSCSILNATPLYDCKVIFLPVFLAS